MSYPMISVFKGVDRQWYWQLVSRNGKVTADNEGYPTKSNATRAAKALVRSVVKRVVPLADPVVFSVTRNDKLNNVVEIEFC